MTKNLLLSLFSIALVGCAKDVVVKQVQPQRAGFATESSTSKPTIESYLDAAESAWKKLEANPTDSKALGDYNFAVSRICSSIRANKMRPWKAPVQVGSRSITW